MDTLKIKAILAAARHRSLSKAAEEFSYTPSAFSHMLAGFEEELGVRLFKRSHAGVTPTREGELLLPRLEQLLHCEREIEALAADLAGERGRTLRIATYSSISRSFLSAFLKDFKTAHPDIRLSLHVADDLEGLLENGKADVIFADDILLEKREWFPLVTDRYCAVAPLSLLEGRQSITREELYAFPHLFTDDEYLRGVLDKERFAELIHVSSEDDQAVVAMVRAGLGIAVMPELVMRGNAEGVSLVPLEPQITRTLGFACRRTGLSVSAAKFVRYIKSKL
ncbi:MAG: LysR family transcriptional regulator [Clostridia bacterium]|nr:LysR family transcriptional regulator [Clostridia bacterium]